MGDWVPDDDLYWDDEVSGFSALRLAAEDLAGLVFLSDHAYQPEESDHYNMGFLEREDWWPLVMQLEGTVDLDVCLSLLEELEPLLNLDGVPSALLENPLGFLELALDGHLPTEASGRRIGSRKLVKIALLVTRLARELPDVAQTAAQAWAGVQRALIEPPDLDDEEAGLTDLLLDQDLPAAVTGFSMLVAMTMIRWPDRAEGVTVPDGFLEPELYDQVYAEWQALSDSPTVTAQGAGEAEALFAQGQLAHLLAELGSVEGLGPDQVGSEPASLSYSRLSRAILWVHNQCRRCPEREALACKVARGWPEQPVPLIDVAAEVANTGRIEGCVLM